MMFPSPEGITKLGKHLILYVKHRHIQSATSQLFSQIEKDEQHVTCLNVNQFSIGEILEHCQDARTISVDDLIFRSRDFDPSIHGVTHVSNWRGNRFYSDLGIELLNQSTPNKVLLALHLDLHDGSITNSSSFTDEQMYEHFQVLAWVYEHGVEGLESLDARFYESWMKGICDPSDFHEFLVSKFPHRIDLPFCINEKLVNPHIRKRGRKKTAVIGTKYPTRILAEKTLKENSWSLNVKAEEILRYLVVGNKRFIKSSKVHNLLQYLRRRIWYSFLDSLKYAWVDGGHFKYPTFKFVESVARGTCVISNSHSGFSDYGFLDGESYYFASPEDFGKAVEEIEVNPELAFIYAERAQKILINLHTSNARSKQFILCLEALSKGEFVEARFIKGNFSISST